MYGNAQITPGKFLLAALMLLFVHKTLWWSSKTNGCFYVGSSVGHLCQVEVETQCRKLEKQLRLEKDMLLFTLGPLVVHLLCSKTCIKYFTHIYSYHSPKKKNFFPHPATPLPLATISLFCICLSLFLFRLFICFVLEAGRQGEGATSHAVLQS